MCLTGSRRISRKIGWINIVVALLAAQAAADSAFFSVPLQRTGVDANAGGLVTITLAQNTSSLVLQASNLAPSRVCTVLVAGIARGTFVPNRAGRGQLTLSVPSAPGTNILNFDPRGKQLSVVQNGAVVLHARCAEFAAARAVTSWLVSISHTETMAMASAIALSVAAGWDGEDVGPSSEPSRPEGD